jgi:hypothetical protein
VRKEEVLHKVKGKKNILHTMKRGKANWISHILIRNCLLKHITEGKIEGWMEVMERQGRRGKKLLNDIKNDTIQEIESFFFCSSEQGFETCDSQTHVAFQFILCGLVADVILIWNVCPTQSSKLFNLECFFF